MLSIRARVLAARIRVIGLDRWDYEQELAVGLILALPRLDAQRGRPTDLARIVLDRGVATAHRSANAAKRGRAPSRSFVPGTEDPAVSEAWARIDLSLDVAAILPRLPPKLAAVAAMLAMGHTRAETARRLEIHPATVRRRIVALRTMFAAAGLSDYLDMSRTGSDADCE